MARIRTIKPEFFEHEDLYKAEVSSGLPLRVAFAGLWTQADRAGRFEWRAGRLKLHILPYDQVDFSAVLSALEEHGFIRRYDVDGKSFGYVPSWDEHQHINAREPDSTLPAPYETSANTDPVPDDSGSGTGEAPSLHVWKGNGNGKGTGTGTGRERGACVSARATPVGLDSIAWERWKTYRIELRKPIRQASMLAAQRSLAAFGADQGPVVEQSIANGWQGLFALKSNALPVRSKAKTVAELEAEALARGENPNL